MHRCLQVPEILREICQLLQLYGPGSWYCWRGCHKQSRQAQVNLSRTCRAFYEIATEELWAALGPPFGLDPLLNLMAHDLWEYSDVGSTQGRVSNPITQAMFQPSY